MKEILSLTTARAINYQHIPGGIASITMEDVCMVLARLPRHISLYARMKYCGEWDGEHYGSLFHETLDAVKTLGGCIDVNAGIQANKYDKLCQLVLYDAVQGDSNRCPTCHGTKSVLLKSAYVVCPSCGGTGRLKITDAFKAEFIGYCDARAYRRHASGSYQALLAEIEGHWDYQIEKRCFEVHKT